jgi:hypothetical protein
VLYGREAANDRSDNGEVRLDDTEACTPLSPYLNHQNTGNGDIYIPSDARNLPLHFGSDATELRKVPPRARQYKTKSRFYFLRMLAPNRPETGFSTHHC